jgi:hypothetical protein
VRDPSKPAVLSVKSDVNQFIGALADGDVLLFDSLDLVSHIIKLADNAPVNHCAIFEKAGANVIHASLPGPGGKSVRRDSLSDIIDPRHDHTITALRHSTNSAFGAKALNRAKEWLRKDTRYGYKDLLGLGASMLNRSYGGDLPPTLQWLVDGLSGALNGISALSVAGSDPKWSVTCSEFVYCCYIEADGESLEIMNPLSSWSGGRRIRRHIIDPKSGEQTLSPFVAFADSEDEPGAYEEILFTNPRTAPTPAPLTWTEGDSPLVALANERYGIFYENRINAYRQKPTCRASQVPEPYAQTVTPRDLRDSPSFEVVGILHVQ